MLKSNTLIERTYFPFQRIEDSVVIVDTKDRLLHQLNEVGSYIWEYLDKKPSLDEIVDSVAEEYEVDLAVAQREIPQFLETLLENHLIKISEKSPTPEA
jgi:methyltransferase-like protein